MKSGWVILLLSLFSFSASIGEETGDIIIIPFCTKQIMAAGTDTAIVCDKAILFQDPAVSAGNNLNWHRGILSTLNQTVIDSSGSRQEESSINSKPKEYEIGGSGIIDNPSRLLQSKTEEN